MTLEESLAEIERLRKQIKDLQEENAALRLDFKKRDEELQKVLKRLEELEREAARQAAPFRRREAQKVKSEDKKKPGRKAGHRGFYRPEPMHVDRHVEVELDSCPHCQGPVTQPRSLTQFIEEIPPIRPIVTRLVTWSGKCAKCGEVHSTHPLQTSRAQGAAGSLLGPRAAAFAVLLNKHYGVTLRKTCKIFKQGFGLSLTSGGLTHLLARAAKKMKSQYDQLIEEIRDSRAVYADETSWFVGRAGYWLWVFTTPEATLYHVASSRGHPIARQILGEEFKNVLISDCAPIYDKFGCPQHKCIAHHQKVIKQQRELPSTHDPTFLNECARFFEDVVTLAHARDKISSEDFAARHIALKESCDRLLARDVAQPGDRKIQNRMKRCGEALLGCLKHAVDPTNNRAERALRPAVISRKVSCGNKTEKGARTWEILTSLSATAQQRGEDFLEKVSQSIRLPATPPVPVG